MTKRWMGTHWLWSRAGSGLVSHGFELVSRRLEAGLVTVRADLTRIQSGFACIRSGVTRVRVWCRAGSSPLSLAFPTVSRALRRLARTFLVVSRRMARTLAPIPRTPALNRRGLALNRRGLVRVACLSRAGGVLPCRTFLVAAHEWLEAAIGALATDL